MTEKEQLEAYIEGLEEIVELCNEEEHKVELTIAIGQLNKLEEIENADYN